jgi:hypothetical protein
MSAKVSMPCPKRMDPLVRETEFEQEDATIMSIKVNKRNGSWTGLFESVSSMGAQTISSDEKSYAKDQFHPVSWVEYPEAGTFAPRGYVYCPNRGVVVSPDKINITDIPEPLHKEKREAWVARIEGDDSLKSMRAWKGFAEFLDNTWKFYKGEELPGVTR